MRRRAFLALLAPALLAAPTALRQRAHAQGPRHPEPRAGITADRVLKGDQLRGFDDLTPLFDGIREFPHIADGVGCACGCAELPGYRSLLTCFEQPGMALACEICQEQGRLVIGRAREGQSLARIRAAVDARWSSMNAEHCA
jgi:hypothetical protein